MATAKAPMLMKPAMSGVDAPPVKNAPGCGGGDDEVGKGMKVVVVEGCAAEGSAGFVSVDTTEEVTVISPSLGDNRLERGKEEEDDMAGGQGDGFVRTRRLVARVR